eukprot:CAMPEP_0174900680 /NCGR_PEP_ID=MMETSP0167-20121228/32227_1 /TAXON_ID=38298 /ORGANISM="Rhodella maculata, Strain CCMP736" /LENGTH=486 /DNA_ID=CAMNT_0016142147 /DNA_START=11 /DNA_END=1471 /DNA_ORIENTATION=+
MIRSAFQPTFSTKIAWASGAAVVGRRPMALAHRKPDRVTLSASSAPPAPTPAHAPTPSLTLSPIKRLEGTVSLPGSKSLSNRVLLLAALSSGTTDIKNLLESDDVTYMLQALTELKIPYIQHSPTSVSITGTSGRIPEPSDPLTLFLGNAGTAMRPLTAALATASSGTFILDGTPRMRERPIQDLVSALKPLGVDVVCSDTGCPPVTIKASGIKGGVTTVSGKISSQYLSALLMAAPLAKEDVTIKITDTLVSVPYVLMTINLMRRFGVEVSNVNNSEFVIKAGQQYQSPGEIFVEGDASSASYFLAGGAITGGPVTVEGCGLDSIQGDVDFANKLEMMGAKVEWGKNSITVSRDLSTKLKGVDVDCGDIPDAAMTLAVVGMFATGETRIRNVYNWRVKETERMKAIVTELGKLGAQVEEGLDYCVVQECTNVNSGVEIETYDDHRMAMAFALAACSGVDVVIRDPACTKKTFPTYFDVLKGLVKE